MPIVCTKFGILGLLERVRFVMKAPAPACTQDGSLSLPWEDEVPPPFISRTPTSKTKETKSREFMAGIRSQPQHSSAWAQHGKRLLRFQPVLKTRGSHRALSLPT